MGRVGTEVVPRAQDGAHIAQVRGGPVSLFRSDKVPRAVCVDGESEGGVDAIDETRSQDVMGEP